MLNKLLSGFVFNIINLIVQVFVGLFVFRALLLYMGETDFGYWAITIALISQISLFELGLGLIISRHVSRDDELSTIRKNIVTNAIFILAFFSVFYIVCFVLGIWSWLQFNPEFSLTTGEPILVITALLVISYALNFLAGSLQGYLSAKFCFKRLNAIKIFANIGRLLLILFVVENDLGVIGLALSFCVIAVLDLFFKYICANNVGLADDFELNVVNVTSVRSLLKTGWLFFPFRVNDYVRNNSAILVTGMLNGPSSAVPLRLAGRLMEIYVEFSITLNSILTPYFSKLDGDQDTDLFKKFRVSLFCSTALSLFIFINILMCGEWFLKFWLGEIPDKTWVILQILAIGYCVANMQGPVGSILIAKGYFNTMTRLSLIEISSTLILMLVLASYMGGEGASLALTMSLLFTRGVVQPFMVIKLLNTSLVQYCMPMVTASLAVACVSIFSYFLTQYLEQSEAVKMFCFVICECLFLLLLSLLLYKNRMKYEKN